MRTNTSFQDPPYPGIGAVREVNGPLFVVDAPWTPLMAFVSLFLLVGGHAAASPRANTTAFVDVTVIPMDRERVLVHQTVLVRGGTIRAVGPTGHVAVPRGTVIIRGEGRWLIPGLIDMHTHVDDPADFPLFLFAGVTTTLNMGGASKSYLGPVRGAIRTGKILGPEPLIALMIDGPGDPGGSAVVPSDTADARAIVRRAMRDGYDYLKIYSRMTPEIFEAVMDEAQKVGIPVVGHVVRSVGLQEGMVRGQTMIAHAEEYLTVFADTPPDSARIPELVRLTSTHGVAVTANIFGVARIAEQWGHPETVSEYLGDPSSKRLRPDIWARWRRASYARLKGSYSAEARFCEKLVAALHDAGVPVLIGTDTPDIPGMAPGTSALLEIEALHAAGFSNYDALASATSVAGAFVERTLHNAQPFGVVGTERRADLLLLRGSPLESLDALRQLDGVMLHGRWLPAVRLAHMVNAPVKGYEGAERAIERFMRDIDSLGANVAIARNRSALKAPSPLRMPERLLIAAGYRELRTQQPQGALALFHFSAELYPAGWEAYNGLGDAYARVGDTGAAAANWRRSTVLNPKNADALEKIAKLGLVEPDAR